MGWTPRTDEGSGRFSQTHATSSRDVATMSAHAIGDGAGGACGVENPVRCVESILFLSLMEMLDHSCIRYCVVGDTRYFPDLIESDIDIVVEPRAVPEARRLIRRFADKYQLDIVQLLQHEQSAFYYVIAWMDKKNRVRFLKPDLCGDYFRDGRRLISAGELLSERRRAVGADGCDKGFYVAAPQHEFLYYFLKRVDKKSVEDTHCEHLSLQWRLAPAQARTCVDRFFGPRYAERVGEAAESGNWTLVRDILPELRRSLQAAANTSIKEHWRELVRRLSRMVRPTGLMVAFLGVDGAGKSSVINRVLNDLLPVFRRSAYFHFRPYVGRSDDRGAVVSAPHGKPLRSLPISMMKLGYYGFHYSLGYLLQVRMLLARSTLVAFDRYAHDVLVDPRRYRYGGPKWWARLVAGSAPSPDLLLLLDAPVSVTQARKREVDPADAARQRLAYRALTTALPYGVVIDAAQPLDAVVSEVERHILRLLAQRTRNRHVL